MKKVKILVTSNDLLKWLTSAVLVLSIITFSENVSELTLYYSERPKTELNESRKVNSRKVVYFKKALGKAKFAPESRKENFISIQFHQKNRTTVKLKLNRKELPTLDQQRKNFLIHLSTKNSDEFELNQLRG